MIVITDNRHKTKRFLRRTFTKLLEFSYTFGIGFSTKMYIARVDEQKRKLLTCWCCGAIDHCAVLLPVSFNDSGSLCGGVGGVAFLVKVAAFAEPVSRDP